MHMIYPSSSTGDGYKAGRAHLLAGYIPFDIVSIKQSTTAFRKCAVSFTFMSRYGLHPIRASALRCLGCEHVSILL